MYIFFYGTNSYAIHEKVESIKDKYRQKCAGDFNLLTLDSEAGLSITDFRRQVEALPFLATSRLIIVLNPLSKLKKDDQEKVAAYLPNIPTTTVVVFAETGSYDRRVKLFHALQKAKIATEVKDLNNSEMINFIVRRVKTQNGRISHAGAALLAEYIGPDLWRATNEVNKLVDYAGEDLIKEETVRLLVSPEVSSDIFALVDAISFRKPEVADQALIKLRQTGEADIKILGMIVYGLRNLLIVKDYLSRGATRDQIGRKTRLHPYVLTKTMAASQRFELPELKKHFVACADTDARIKTGQIKADLGLDLLIMRLVR